MDKDSKLNLKRPFFQNDKFRQLNIKRMKKIQKDMSVIEIIKKQTPCFSKSDFFCSLVGKILIPTHFRSILDIFVSLDNVVNGLINKCEPLYIDKISKGLQELNKKTFDINIFGQILSIFPESYFYEYYDKLTPNKCQYYSETVKLIPNLSYGNPIDFSPRKSDKCFSLNQLVLRRNCFHERLLQIVKEKHDDFLVNVKGCPELCMKYPNKHMAWHQEFDLENCIDNIRPTPLSLTNKPSTASLLIHSSKKSIKESSGQICKNIFNAPPLGDKSLRKDINKLLDEQPCVTKPITIKSTDINNDDKLSNSTTKVTELSQKQKLPFHLKILFELFVGLDRTVYNVYTKGEMCYLTNIAPSVTKRFKFSQLHLGKIITIYPDAYSLKWQRVHLPYFIKPTKKIDIAIKPNLRYDTTRSALISPDKGYLSFDFVRLKERRQLFMEKCLSIVLSDYTKFLSTNLSITQDQHWQYLHTDRWHPLFNVDAHVSMIKSSDMPRKVDESLEKMELKSISQFMNIIQKKWTMEDNRKRKSLIIKEGKYGSKEELIDDKKRRILTKLPNLVKILEIEFYKVSYKPLGRVYLADIGCKSLSMSKDSFEEHLDMLICLLPDLITNLDWSTPHISINECKWKFEEVSEKLAKELELA